MDNGRDFVKLGWLMVFALLDEYYDYFGFDKVDSQG